MTGRLQDKVALITGGGTGIGRAIARRFVEEGATVAVCGRTLHTLTEVTDSLLAQGGKALAVPCDVADPEQVQAMVRQIVETFDKLDVLINNAGVRASISTIEDLSEQEWQQTFDVDAKGSWLCAKYAIPEMRKTGSGSIVMISSISAHIGQPKQGCYNAAKAAQELLLKCIAVDFAADRIRANSICPAWVRTEMNRQQLAEMAATPDQVFPPGLSHRDVLRLHPAGRIGEPEDIAAAAVYLASDEASWVTGSSLMVDGGYTCQ